MKNSEGFKILQNDLKSYMPALRQAADTIVVQEVSHYPIFVVHQHTVDIGINIVDKETTEGNWSVNASTLEEFVAKQIIDTEKVDDFRHLFRNHRDELCLFVLNESGANFVFMPM
jgi:hypothetical protein